LAAGGAVSSGGAVAFVARFFWWNRKSNIPKVFRPGTVLTVSQTNQQERGSSR
jgi:hypothetical protein